MNALSLKCCAAAVLTLFVAGAAVAQEAAIRKNLAQRLPGLPKIDEVTPTPVPGVFEVRLGTDILYTDAEGNHIIQGEIIDVRTRSNLTQARIDKLTAIDFAALPLKDAMVVKQGNGERKLAVFVDPNCGYCKRFERDLTTVKNVTIYSFLYPILGPDSNTKSRDIWCAKDSMKAWRGWMLDNVKPPATVGECDSSALERNLAMGQKYRVNGTPALVFENGVKKPGALPASEVERLLAEASGKS